MEEEEELDPRVQVELEVLNTATDDINKLEAKLEEANNAFRTTLSESTVQLKTLAKKLGSCIEKARPYYEALELARTSQLDCQRAAVQYQRANALHQAAKETIAKAEEMFVHHENRHFDSTWQEVLNRAIIKVMEAEAQKASSEREHLKRAGTYQQAEQQVQQLHRGLRSSIAKSTVYFEEKARVQSQLETQKEHVQRLQQAITASKASYAQSLRRLEQISEQIHEQRRCRLPREPGVGAELPPAAATDTPTATTSSFPCPPSPTTIAAAAATSLPHPPTPTHDHTAQDVQYWKNLREKLAKLEEANEGGEGSRGSDGSKEEEEMRERSVSGSSDTDDTHKYAYQRAPHTYAHGTQDEHHHQHHLTKTKDNIHPSATLPAPRSVQSCQPEGGKCRREDVGVIVPVGECGRELMIGEERRVEEEEIREREEEKRVRKGPVGGDCNTENYLPCNSAGTDRSVVSSSAVLDNSSSPNRQQQIKSSRKESLKIGDIHIILCVDEDDGNTQAGFDNTTPSQDKIEQPEDRQASSINTSKSSRNDGLRTADGEYENESYGAVEDAKVEMHGDGKKVASVQYKEIRGMVEMHGDDEGENVTSAQYNSVKTMARMYDEKVNEVAAGTQYSGEIDNKNNNIEMGSEVKSEVGGLCNSEINGNELTELCNEENYNEVSESSSENKYNKTKESCIAVNDNEIHELYSEGSSGMDDKMMPLGRSSPPPAQCIPSRGLSAIPEELEVCVVQE